MSNDTNYTSKAITTKISATSRASVKINDNFYTVEMTEEREFIPNTPDVNLDKERELLWDAINLSVDNQILDIKEQFAKSRQR